MCRGELEQLTVDPDFTAVANQRPTTGALVVTFNKRSNLEWSE